MRDFVHANRALLDDACGICRYGYFDIGRAALACVRARNREGAIFVIVRAKRSDVGRPAGRSIQGSGRVSTFCQAGAAEPAHRDRKIRLRLHENARVLGECNLQLHQAI